MKIPTLSFMLLLAAAPPDAPNHLAAGMPINVDDSLISAFKNEHCLKDDTVFLYHVLENDGTINISSDKLISVAGATPKPSRFASTVHCGTSGECPVVSMGVSQKICEQSGSLIEIFHNPLDPTEIERIKVRDNLDSQPLVLPEEQDSSSHSPPGAAIVGNGLLGTPVQLWKIKGTSNIFTTIPTGSFDDVKCLLNSGEIDSLAPPLPPVVRRNLRQQEQTSSWALPPPSTGINEKPADGAGKNKNVVAVPAFNRDVLQERNLLTEVASGCNGSCYELRLGIAVDSKYCAKYGGNNFAATQIHVEQLVEDMSNYYEVVGICTRLRIGYLEIFCQGQDSTGANADPYTGVQFNNTGCTTGVPGALQGLQQIWEATPSRMSADWDVAMFLSGWAGVDNSASGCAWRPGIWSATLLGFRDGAVTVPTHEIGHNMGCHHTNAAGDPDLDSANNDDLTCVMRSGAGSAEDLQKFCTACVNTINNHIASNDACNRNGSTGSTSCQCPADASPSNAPSSMPSEGPSAVPSGQPSDSARPSTSPSSMPSGEPSTGPSGAPSTSSAPSRQPSGSPTASSAPSRYPSAGPSAVPSSQPSAGPSDSARPSTRPSIMPSGEPSNRPSGAPSTSSAPSRQPSGSPTASSAPSRYPSAGPSVVPSGQPSAGPSDSAKPSASPSIMPSGEPSNRPSGAPSTSSAPSQQPSGSPSRYPSAGPSEVPSGQPSAGPSESARPSAGPSTMPSGNPSAGPSGAPSISNAPTPTSEQPSGSPTVSSAPSHYPSAGPSVVPSSQPSAGPSDSARPSTSPSIMPSGEPSNRPSGAPSTSSAPSPQPSGSPTASSAPSRYPSAGPSASPSTMPSGEPSNRPSGAPSTSSAPSQQPSGSPTASSAPSRYPSAGPSESARPSARPSYFPTAEPSTRPSGAPSISNAPTTSQCSADSGAAEDVCSGTDENFICVYKVGDGELKQKCETQTTIDDGFQGFGKLYKNDHYLVSCDCCPDSFDLGGNIGVMLFHGKKGKSVKGGIDLLEACPPEPSSSPSYFPTAEPSTRPSAAPSTSSAPTTTHCSADSGEAKDLCSGADENFICVYKAGDSELKQKCEAQETIDDGFQGFGKLYKKDHYLVSCDCCPLSFDLGGKIGAKMFVGKTAKSVKGGIDLQEACPSYIWI